MNILLIGDDPKIVGGVTNYTRPLAQGLQKAGVKVHYLHTVALNTKYDFKAMRIETRQEDGVEIHSLINGRALLFNYDQLDVDTGEWFDETFKAFLSNKNINLIHINEIFGLSSHLISVAKGLGIKVITTVHEYWWLCPHRVMVDQDRAVCDGPNNPQKCAQCVTTKFPNYNSSKEKFKYQLRTTFPTQYKKLTDYIKSKKKQHYSLVDLSSPRPSPLNPQAPGLVIALQKRLYKNIEALNHCDKIICVSKDVKRILTTYGVKPELCTVDHIGSMIADKKWELRNNLTPKHQINFGFIGGVTYYKGVHLIVQAYIALPEEVKDRARVNIYGGGDPGYFMSMQNLINSEGSNLDRKNIHFHGKYSPTQLTDIGSSIDISILPSMCADTAPQTIFESFSLGIPIIAPNSGGFSDFVRHGVNGLIFNYGDPQSLSAAMLSLLENPDQIIGFSKNIQKTKGMGEHVASMLALYKSFV